MLTLVLVLEGTETTRKGPGRVEQYQRKCAWRFHPGRLPVGVTIAPCATCLPPTFTSNDRTIVRHQKARRRQCSSADKAIPGDYARRNNISLKFAGIYQPSFSIHDRAINFYQRSGVAKHITGIEIIPCVSATWNLLCLSKAPKGHCRCQQQECGDTANEKTTGHFFLARAPRT